VTTDIIVGFPGETEEDFERTLEVVAEAGYDSAYTFIFSPRPGTAPRSMTTSSSPEVIAERFARLKAVVDRSALERTRDRVGRTRRSSSRAPSRSDPDAHRADPPGQARATSPRARRRGSGRLEPGTSRRCEITGAGPPPRRGELVQSRRALRDHETAPIPLLDS
jgi:tRNA-2-methylthio-N6-dimethylallyladenosine synthase